MWVMAAKDEAKSFVRDRVKPTFEGCAPVAGQMLSAEAFEFTFASMPFYFTGAGSPSKLMSKPIRWLFLDEVRNYPPGALDTVLKRTRAFWNSRRVLISTPDMKDDAVHRAFLAGDQRVFHFVCPCCGQLQPIKFEQLKARHPQTGQPCKFNEVPGVKNERGQWNYDLLAEHLRYQCAACGHLIADTPAERKAIARNGRFVRVNPNAPRHRVSFHWNALLPPWVSWRGIVEEFINARAAARCGDLAPLKTFINETLGEPWSDQLGEIDDYDFLELRRGDYDFGDVWPEEIVRYMAADKQEAGGNITGGSFGRLPPTANPASLPMAAATPKTNWNTSGAPTMSGRPTPCSIQVSRRGKSIASASQPAGRRSRVTTPNTSCTPIKRPARPSAESDSQFR